VKPSGGVENRSTGELTANWGRGVQNLKIRRKIKKFRNLKIHEFLNFQISAEFLNSGAGGGGFMI
jgi:hypothetical protein